MLQSLATASTMRLSSRLPQLAQKAVFRAPFSRACTVGPLRALPRAKTATGSASQSLSALRSGARAYSQQSYKASLVDGVAQTHSPLRKFIVGGAIFGGTLVAINVVFNGETRDDGGMSTGERDHLHGTFMHLGLGLGMMGVAARQMLQSGLVFRIMQANPWIVLGGGLAASFASLIAVRSINPDNYVPKYLAWSAFNITQAAILAPMVCFFPPALVVRAGLYSIAMMGSLSLVGATAKQDKYLYIGGPLLAGAAIVALSGLAPLVVPMTAVRTLSITQNLWLYGGLAVFGGFTLYDVQKVLNHARLAESRGLRLDPVAESVALELDFINIFVRMLQILSMSQKRK